MKHVENLTKDSKNLDVIVKGTVTGKSVNSIDEVLYQIETPCGDCFEANEKCVYTDVTKPVEVHQYVADWYENNKDNLDYNLWNYIIDWYQHEPCEFIKWFNRSSEVFQTIVNMHQFGYKIKEEKKYLVKLIQGSQYLHTDHSGETYFTAFSQSNYTKNKLEELNLEWVFDCPGIKLEEVE